MTDNIVTPPSDDSVYILITQCLQNGFFLASESRLCLPTDVVKNMLVGDQSIDDTLDLNQDFFNPSDNKRKIVPTVLQKGPLYQFLNAVIKSPNNELHVIHVKDWHTPSARYDEERKRYGVHCEAGTWEAEPIDGYDEFLQPWRVKDNGGKGNPRDGGYKVPSLNTTFYEVLSDSVYDFKPSVTRQAESNATTKTLSQLETLLDTLIDNHPTAKRVCMIVIGVYSDIKIKTLLVSLRSRYNIDNLVVSDVLTGAPSLERHLSGLDFADKVLNVEIIHSLNELVKVLIPNTDTPAINQKLIASSPDFRRYRTYYLDKQNLLGFQDQKLVEYLELTRERASSVYEQIYITNKRLILVGFGLLLVTLLLSVIKFLDPERFSLDILVLLGGLSISQLLVGFFFNPLSRLQENLNNLVRLRNYMETYSLVTALFRHHFTSVENLYGKDGKLETIPLDEQMRIVQAVAKQMAVNFRDISLGVKGETSEGSETTNTNTHDNPENQPVG